MTGVLTTAAVLGAPLFTSWALYITLVEHPARLDSGAAAALTSRWTWLTGALAVGSVIPLTLLAIRPITRRLLAPDRLDDHETIRLLRRWGRLHAVRTTLGAAGLLAFLRALGAR